MTFMNSRGRRAPIGAWTLMRHVPIRRAVAEMTARTLIGTAIALAWIVTALAVLTSTRRPVGERCICHAIQGFANASHSLFFWLACELTRYQNWAVLSPRRD